MTKDEAIKYLNEFIVLKKISNITEEKAIECFKLAVEALEQEQQPRWVPCSERLPEENEYVGDVCKYYLIQDEYGDMYVAHLSSVGWIPINSLKAISDEVIAWMPLPEPYNTESEDKE